MIGKIIHLDEKGWGFITSPDIEFTRIFFHWTGLKQDTLNFKELKRGMRVEFTEKQSPDPEKGWRAIKIKVIDDGEKDGRPDSEGQGGQEEDSRDTSESEATPE